MELSERTWIATTTMNPPANRAVTSAWPVAHRNKRKRPRVGHASANRVAATTRYGSLRPEWSAVEMRETEMDPAAPERAVTTGDTSAKPGSWLT